MYDSVCTNIDMGMLFTSVYVVV
jgi:hypothetical protein